VQQNNAYFSFVAEPTKNSADAKTQRSITPNPTTELLNSASKQSLSYSPMLPSRSAERTGNESPIKTNPTKTNSASQTKVKPFQLQIKNYP